MSQPADRGWRFRGWMTGRPRGRTSAAAALVWLAFIVFPLVDAVTARGPVAGRLLAIAGAAVFVATYVWLVFSGFGEGRLRPAWARCGVLIAIAVALTVADRSDWGFLFVYCAACVALVTPPAVSFQAVAGLAGLAALCTAAGGGGASGAVGYGAAMAQHPGQAISPPPPSGRCG